MHPLNSKTVFITGASRGIGAATAKRFAEAGVRRFILHYNSNQGGAEEAAGAVRLLGADAYLIRADFSQAEGIDEGIAQYRQLGFDTDILINNAGSLVQRAKLAEFTNRSL